MAAASLENLIDRTDISDVLIAYATALDQRDWTRFRSIFTDRVFVDMRSFDPNLYSELDADDLVTGAKRLSAFDATQHMSTNHVHRIDGDSATCVSYMQAGHFLKRPDGDFYCFLYGYYTYSLIRTKAGWKISKYTLQVTAQQGDPRVFEWAGFQYEGK